MDEHGDWREQSFDLYRTTWTDLHRLSDGQRISLAYWVEELLEALLDLKQAVIDEDPARVSRCASEVRMLWAELRLKREGDEHG